MDLVPPHRPLPVASAGTFRLSAIVICMVMLIAFGSRGQSQAVQLWGVANEGGVNNVGTLFSVDVSSGTITKRVDFSQGQGASPGGSLMRASNGKLYGTTSTGGANNAGVIYEYDLETLTFLKLYDLTTEGGTAPRGSMLETSAGVFYGLTFAGGSNDLGVIFEYNAGTNSYTKKVDLTFAEGHRPSGTFIKASNGKLYATTSEGGSSNLGTIIEYEIGSTAYTKVAQFTGPNGSLPYGSLIEASPGVLYGATYGGGANIGGVIFEYVLSSGTLTKKYDFEFPKGRSCFGKLLKASNGLLYGLTARGADMDLGALFEYNPATNLYVKRVGLSDIIGGHPYGSMMEATDGMLYGAMWVGGAHNKGSILRYNTTTHAYAKIADFDGTNGERPAYDQLIEASLPIILTSPNGGEIWKVGSVEAITWTATDVAHVTLEYSTDNGATWSVIVSSTDASAGTYSWTIPNTPTTLALVRISDATNSLVYDVSNSTFIIKRLWEVQSTGTNKHLNDCDFVNGTTGWVVGDGSVILKTEDGGTTWQNQTDNPGVPSNKQWNGVSFVNALQGWVVGTGGSNGTVIHTEDGGLTWTEQTSLDVNPNDVAFADLSNGWVVGNGGSIFYTVNGGSSWQEINPHPTSEHLNGIFVLPGTTTGYIAGEAGTILKTTDGTTWTTQNSSTSNHLNDASFISTTTGWVVGNSGTILSTDDGGSIWSSQESGTTSHLNGVSFVSSTLGWAVGNGGTILRYDLSLSAIRNPARTIMNGGWTQVASGTTYDLSAVAVGDGLGWTVADSGLVLNHIASTLVLTEPNGAEALSSATSFAIQWVSEEVENVSLQYSIDGGINWQEIAASVRCSTGSYLWNVPALVTANALVRIRSIEDSTITDVSDSPFSILCTPCNSSVSGYVTKLSEIMAPLPTAGGSSSPPMKAGDPIRSIDVSLGKKPSGSRLIATTDSAGYFEFDDIEAGDYELQITPPAGAHVAIPHLGMYSFNLGVGTDLTEMNFQVMITPPDSAWRVVESGTTRDLFAVGFFNEEIAVAVGDSGTILRSTDGGVTWSEATIDSSAKSFAAWYERGNPFQGRGSGDPMKGLNLPSPSGSGGGGSGTSKPCNGKKAISVGSNGKILKTEDYGATWKPKSGTSQNLRGVTSVDENNFVAVGENLTLIYSSDGGESWFPSTIVGPGLMISEVQGQTVNSPFNDSEKYFKNCSTAVARRLLSAEGSLIAVGEGGLILKSTDKGVTWVAQTAVSGESYHAGTGFDHHRVFAAGDSTFLTSTDGGASWTIDPLRYGKVRHTATVGPTSAYAVGDNGLILFSNDNGVSWSSESSPATGDLFGVGASITGNLYARIVLTVGEGGLIMRKIERAGVTSVLDIEDGWNLVSLPARPVSYDKDSLFRFSASSAFSYDNGYAIAQKLSMGRGYWMKFNGSTSIGISGTVTASETVDVNERWNLIGSISTEIEPGMITSVPPGLITSSFFGYSGGGYGLASTISPGKAYWVKVNAPGKLVLSSSVSSSAARINIVPTNELPPAPPELEDAVAATIPQNYALKANFPNPFNPSTTIGFDLPEDAVVSLRVHDVLGREVAVLAEHQRYLAGTHEVQFFATNLATGFYFYRISAQGQTGSFTDVKKVLLLK